MEHVSHRPPIPFRAEHPLEWLAAYLQRRAYLASCQSGFQCDPACTRPGCKNQDLQIPVSLVDLMGAALHREMSVAAIFPGNYSLGLLANDREDWIRIVSLRLRKPCPFLADDRCSIYPVRPLPCILFPEYLANEGTFAANAGKGHFKDYLCFRRPIPLSPDRAQILARLKQLWVRESLVSSFYLFGHGRCHLDGANLIPELLDAAGSPGGAESPGAPGPGRVIPHPVIENYFRQHIAGRQPFAGAGEKIHHLDSREGQAEFLQYLEDDRLAKKLKRYGDDRALVFRYVRGKLQARRRNIAPGEYKFY